MMEEILEWPYYVIQLNEDKNKKCGNIYYQENRVIIMYGEHNVIYSLNAIYQRKWEVSILASGGEHQSISLHQGERYSAKELTVASPSYNPLLLASF